MNLSCTPEFAPQCDEWARASKLCIKRTSQSACDCVSKPGDGGLASKVPSVVLIGLMQSVCTRSLRCNACLPLRYRAAQPPRSGLDLEQG